jgi:hypothetical protein
MLQILSIPDSYEGKYLNYDRVFPLIDRDLQELIIKIQSESLYFINENLPVDKLPDAVSKNLFEDFKNRFQKSLENKDLNSINGLENARRIDICLGCTQYIDALYMRYGPSGVQVLEREYTYHSRLNPNLEYRTLDTLVPYKPLILSQPFFNGRTHYQMGEILDQCLKFNIPVHIDGAWITATKNIEIDFNHMAIHSFAASMSKGYGLSGWNRIGVRWTKEYAEDAITIMNDYVQIPAHAVIIGLKFLDLVPPNYLWKKHGTNHEKICKDFDLQPTDSIHLAMKGNQPIGIEALLRYLEDSAK